MYDSIDEINGVLSTKNCFSSCKDARARKAEESSLSNLQSGPREINGLAREEEIN